MKSERGFVTIFALCLIVVVALVVKGIQESDANRNTSADILSAEFDLQSAADGGIYEAAEKVRSGKRNLPANGFPSNVERKKYQISLVTRYVETSHGTIRVNVWGERLKIQDYCRKYSPKYTKVAVKDAIYYGYVLVSVAQLDSPRFGKMYRRAVAYVVDGKGYDGEQDVAAKDKDVVHFMALPSRRNN